MTFKHLIKLFSSLILLLVIGCARQPSIEQDISDLVSNKVNSGTVILLHGLWRDNRAMIPMEDYLVKQGFNVYNISYPSNKYPIEELVTNYLRPKIDRITKENPNEEVHFVTHSMGGILVRQYMLNHDQLNLGRVVMLSPPNKGTELSDLATTMSLEFPGPAGEQLSSDENSWVNSLGPVDFDLGVIAGNYNSNWLTSWILEGDDDGVVTVQSTQVTGMRDFLVLPEKHFRIRKLPIAMQQTLHFIQNGVFYR